MTFFLGVVKLAFGRSGAELGVGDAEIDRL